MVLLLAPAFKSCRKTFLLLSFKKYVFLITVKIIHILKCFEMVIAQYIIYFNIVTPLFVISSRILLSIYFYLLIYLEAVGPLLYL